MTERDDRDEFLQREMLRHLSVIREMSACGKVCVREDLKTRYTIEHATELLSEAAKKTSARFKTANPQVPWAAITKLRTRVAHPYDEGGEEAKADSLWRFGEEEAPVIERRVRRAKAP